MKETIQETKEFSLAAVLTITTSRLLGTLSELYEILNFMTGDDIFTHVIPRAMRICKPELLLQFPQFDTPEFQMEVGFLVEALERETSPKGKQDLIAGWLFKQKQGYGSTFEVKPLETDDWHSMNPIDEAVEMFGEEKVVVAQA